MDEIIVIDEDEDDYMSDSFLQTLEKIDNKNGSSTQIIFSESPKINRRELEETNRKDGLPTPLDSGNKGYNLLKKLGYKPGTGLGKDEDEDEDDYMSDSFLQTLEKIDNKNRSSAKIIFSESPKINRRELEETNRKDGLSKPLDSGNKGYNLLMKMGYKPGTGLGKDGKGREKPIDVKLKIDKTCIGSKSHSIKITKDQLEKHLTADDYRQNIMDRYHSKYQQKSLKKIQQICYDLDKQRQLDCPMHDYYWPMNLVRQAELEMDEEPLKLNRDYIKLSDGSSELSESEKCEEINRYLRIMFSYCFWCGCQYLDKNDLDSHCPGPTKDEH